MNKTLINLNLSNNILIEPEKQTIENIMHFIRKNINLQHLEFTACGLVKEEMMKIASALRRNGSIQAIHLCQNMGIDDELVEYIRQKLHCKPVINPVKIP